MSDALEAASPRPEPSSPPRVDLGAFARMTLKELRESLRDRRTIITLLLMPVVLYPILTLGLRQFFVASSLKSASKELRVGYESERDFQWINASLATSSRLDGSESSRERRTGEPNITLVFQQVQNLDKEVREHTVDIGVRLFNVGENQPARGAGLVYAELVYTEDSIYALQGVEYLVDRYELYNRRLVETKRRPMPMGLADSPVVVARAPLQDLEKSSTIPIAAAIPLVLILMTMTGAVYPAIDLTAGERERGTLEVLIATPVSRVSLLLAKYLAVLTVATLTALMNLVMMTITLLVSGMGPLLVGDVGLTPPYVLRVLGILFLCAVFFSGILLSLTSFSRSFKEAQAYLIPLMLIALSPVVVTVLVPDLKLDGTVMVIPLLNIVLLARDLFHSVSLGNSADAMLSGVSFSRVLIVVGSTLLYAGAAVALAARLFGAEAVLYNASTALSDFWRGKRPLRQQPSASSGLFVLAIMFPIQFIVVNSLAQMAGDLVFLQTFILIGAMTLLYFVVPLVPTLLEPVRIQRAFRFFRPNLLGLLGAILLGASFWMFTYEVILLLSKLEIVPVNAQDTERVAQQVEKLKTIPIGLVIVILGVLPGFCEECMFRGYLFSSLRGRHRPAAVIFITSIAFGLFHIVSPEGFALARLVPSTMIGFLIGFVSWQTKSVIPGMFLHAMNNSCPLIIFFMSQESSIFSELKVLSENQSHFPITYLAAAAVCVALGLFLVRLGRRDDEP